MAEPPSKQTRCEKRNPATDDSDESDLMMTRYRTRTLGVMGLFACLLGLTGCPEAQKIVDFVDSISDGAPCVDNLQCLGGRCLTDQQGYTNGYCTTLDCEESGCSGFFSECFRTEVDATQVTACYELCNFDGTCDRASEGYQCVTLADTGVCLPPGATNAPVQGTIGSSCSTNTQCNGEDAACLQSFLGGYCATLGCTADTDCADGGACVPLNPAGTTDEEKQFACMAACSSGDDCRFGYSCQSYEGSNICLEDDGMGSTVRNPDGTDDGTECVANINCKGGTCIREAEGADGEVSYPGGYCTTRDCASDEDCNGADSICISLSQTTTCRVSCGSDADCRDGYSCRETAMGQGYCDSAVDPPVPPAESSTNDEIEVICSSEKSITFDIPEGAKGFFIAPYTTSNNRVLLKTLRKPDGSTLDIQKDYSFLAVNQEILGNLAPILFPASDDSRFANAFGGGQYTMTVESRAGEVCYYVIPQMQEGRKLSLNLYFVGVQGVSASTAANDRDIQAMVSMMKGIYSKMGITVEVANYFDANSTVTQNYSIIRDFYDVFNLVATSQSPDGGPFSVNVFLINDFNVSDAPGLLGISTGIPGMAALHGSSGSGLVFSTATLGEDNQTLGQTMAHEVGHFLGLRHTTEHGGSAEDPITDTPRCLAPRLGFICSDATNFMFAYALGGDQQTDATAGQGFVLRHNPLVRP
jgi:hypothetical protein